MKMPFSIVHRNIHDAIITLDTWNAVQNKLKEQSPIERGHKMQRHKNLLTGLMYDEKGNLYTPVFTNKKNKKYRYYLNHELTEQRGHPNQVISRLPAHEIETLVERNVRDELLKLIQNDDRDLPPIVVPVMGGRSE